MKTGSAVLRLRVVCAERPLAVAWIGGDKRMVGRNKFGKTF